MKKNLMMCLFAVVLFLSSCSSHCRNTNVWMSSVPETEKLTMPLRYVDTEEGDVLNALYDASTSNLDAATFDKNVTTILNIYLRDHHVKPSGGMAAFAQIDTVVRGIADSVYADQSGMRDSVDIYLSQYFCAHAFRMCSLLPIQGISLAVNEDERSFREFIGKEMQLYSTVDSIIGYASDLQDENHGRLVNLLWVKCLQMMYFYADVTTGDYADIKHFSQLSGYSDVGGDYCYWPNTAPKSETSTQEKMLYNQIVGMLTKNKAKLPASFPLPCWLSLAEQEQRAWLRYVAADEALAGILSPSEGKRYSVLASFVMSTHCESMYGTEDLNENRW